MIVRPTKPHSQLADTTAKVLWTLRKSVSYFRDRRPRVFSVGPETPVRGNVLFSYDPAFEMLSAGPGQPIPNSHTNYWHSMTMVETLVAFGYRVDVIAHRNETFLPTSEYSIFVDTRRNLERLAPLLGSDCLKIMHIDTAHLLFNNWAESRRLLNLQHRRGITLRPWRFQIPNRSIEAADCATTTGNAFTTGTFAYAKKPIYRLPIAAAVSCPWPADKNWDACRRRFMWFSSGGLVHKGLDLALDAFAELPECHLTVCAPVDQEPDFARAYYKELFETPNIETVGWVAVDSPRFREIAASCVGLVYSSCSEGGGACAVNCMHAGLIPIVTYESSVDVGDFGFLLKSDSIADIKETIRSVAHLPADELKDRARRTWDCVRAYHTREKFAEVYRETVSHILATLRATAPAKPR